MRPSATRPHGNYHSSPHMPRLRHAPWYTSLHYLCKRANSKPRNPEQASNQQKGATGNNTAYFYATYLRRANHGQSPSPGTPGAHRTAHPRQQSPVDPEYPLQPPQPLETHAKGNLHRNCLLTTLVCQYSRRSEGKTAPCGRRPTQHTRGATTYNSLNSSNCVTHATN